MKFFRLTSALTALAAVLWFLTRSAISTQDSSTDDSYSPIVPPCCKCKADVVDTLLRVAESPRGNNNGETLSRVIAASVGRGNDLLHRAASSKADVDLKIRISNASRAAVRALVLADTVDAERSDHTTSSHILKVQNVSNLSTLIGGGPKPWTQAVIDNGFPNVEEERLTTVMEYLKIHLEQARSSVHAVCKAVCKVLEMPAQESNGKFPETIAVTMFGTDNYPIDESVIQVLELVGLKQVFDSHGRVYSVELIPLEQLGRPRIDVVVSCFGIFRDLFSNQMALLDHGIKLAAKADEPLEMNFVRKHALEQAKELGIALPKAASRVFSNAAGSYSANVGVAIENGRWESENQLHQQFLDRKGFAFNTDNPSMMEQQVALFKSALKLVDVTLQNIEGSLTDVSHYYDADPTKVVQELRDDKKKPLALIVDATIVCTQVRTLSESIWLDAHTKLLSPSFIEGMLVTGYEGVRELQKRLRNTMGWSVTSGDVDNLVFEDAYNIFINDLERQKRLLATNKNAFRDMVTTFLEIHGRGYWETSEENIEHLHQLFAEVAAQIASKDNNSGFDTSKDKLEHLQQLYAEVEAQIASKDNSGFDTSEK